MSIPLINSFPSYYPVGCPADSIEVDQEVFRLVESSSIKKRDFVPSGERRRFYQAVSCESLALSVLASLDDVPKAYKYFSSIDLERKNKVAVGYITKDSGRVYYDPSRNVGESHINWWTYDGVQPHTFFSNILQIGVDINGG